MTRRFTGIATLTVCALLLARGAEPQTLGTLRWQLQPYCNVLTMTIVQDGSQYHVDGTDDLCGAARRASVVGLAFPNPDGSIGFGLTTVTAPGGTPIHVDATISVASISGTWRDSAGNSGRFVFTPGAAAGGSPRPIPSGGIAPGTITSAQIAGGAITAAQLAPGAIASAVAGLGSCPAGQYLRGIRANGSLQCEPIGSPPVSTSLGAPTAQDGYTPDIAIGVDGLPIISHWNAATDTLLVTHCENPSCTVVRTFTADDPLDHVGAETSIAIGSDGLAVISHSNLTAHALRVTHCNDVPCTSATSLTVTAGGAETSLAIGADGFPVIAHTAGTGLLVTHCGTVTCSVSTTSAPDPKPNTGNFVALAIGADHLPIVSHLDGSVGGLRVTHCTNAACTAAVSTTVDDPANSVGVESAMAIGSDGLAIIAHYDVSADDLRVTHCGNAVCTSATSSTVDAAGFVGQTPAIAIGSDGLAFVTHTDIGARTLRASACGNVSCTQAMSVTIDGPRGSLVGFASAVAIGADGLPIVAHRDLTGGSTLRVTKCGSRTCQ